MPKKLDFAFIARRDDDTLRSKTESQLRGNKLAFAVALASLSLLCSVKPEWKIVSELMQRLEASMQIDFPITSWRFIYADVDVEGWERSLMLHLVCYLMESSINYSSLSTSWWCEILQGAIYANKCKVWFLWWWILKGQYRLVLCNLWCSFASALIELRIIFEEIHSTRSRLHSTNSSSHPSRLNFSM